MGTSHAISGASLWLAGWSFTAIAGLAEPGPDVLTVGTAVVAGAALLPDLDHQNSRMARSGGTLTFLCAKFIGWVGARIHAATKLRRDRSDLDGHRTITHTFVFAALAGAVVTGICGLDTTIGPMPVSNLAAALLVFTFTNLGYAAVRAFWAGRRRRIKWLGRRWHKHHVAALIAAFAAYLIVPTNVWWLGLAVGAGCAIHCLGDVITASGCPVLWPLPIPSQETRYDRKLRRRVPVRVWRTWYLVGTPRWMRFSVVARSRHETLISWALVILAFAATGGIIWSGGWGPNAHN
jgi:membrane-bound metal-dependent hydrolase YbcI (DUF457 family)